MGKTIEISQEKILPYINLTQGKAAEKLGIGRTTLQRKIKKYKIKWHFDGNKGNKISIEKILQYAHLTQEKAAEKLEISETTFKKILKKHKMKWPNSLRKNITLKEVKRVFFSTGTINATANQLNVSREVINLILKKNNLTCEDLLQEYQDIIAPDQITPLRVYGDCIIIADAHIPFIDLRWMKIAINTAKHFGIQQIVIGGDFFDFDRLSWWVKQSNASDIATPLQDELNLAEGVLNILEKQFNSFYFLGGNHWRNRLLSTIGYSIKSDRLLGLVGKFRDPRYKFSEHLDWLLIDDKIRVTHPGKARKLDGTLSRDIGIKFPAQIMVIAHRHRAFAGHTPDGRPSIEIGWMGDKTRMRYIQTVDSSYYEWVNGFLVYVDKKFLPIMDGYWYPGCDKESIL